MADKPTDKHKATIATDDTFYVGFLPVPTKLLGSIVRNVALLVGILMLVAIIIALYQSDPGDGVWQTGEITQLQGIVSVDPYPVICIDDPRSPHGYRTVLLVSMLKKGAAERLGPGHREFIVRGHLISRDGIQMLELLDGDDAVVRKTMDIIERIPIELSEPITLRGEIVDPKCYLGVMKPGHGKVHKACAVRCIAGGIPPMLVTLDDTGKKKYYLLVDEQGRVANDAVLPFVGDPITLTGRIEQRGDLAYLWADLSSIKRQ